MFMFVAIE